MKRYFGTDGIRGVPNKDLSKELIYQVCQAVEDLLNPSSIAVIGDTRSSRRLIFDWISQGFSSSIEVFDYGVLPSGSMPFILNEKNHDLGFIISASHNPSEYNGIKIIDKSGSKLSDNIELSLEETIRSNSLEKKDGAVVQTSKEGEDLYLENLLTLSQNINPDLFKVFMDCANGAVTNVAKKLFDQLSINYQAFNTGSDGSDINKDCGATNPSFLVNNIDPGNIALTFDGDADRLILVDEEGLIANGDVILALLAKYFHQNNMLKGNTVVTTVMANVGLKKALDSMGIATVVTPVGDKYVAEAMNEQGSSLGGEQSGHIILSEFLPVGDGLLTAIFVLSALSFFDESLSVLRKELITEYPQKLVNYTLSNQLEEDVLNQLNDEMKIIENENIPDGRIFVRASGTEPLLRVLIEADSLDKIDTALILIEETITKYLDIQ